jgi:hypothetical protein
MPYSSYLRIEVLAPLTSDQAMTLPRSWAPRAWLNQLYGMASHWFRRASGIIFGEE